MKKGTGKESSVEALARLRRTDPKEWTVDDVGTWLDFIQLSEHRAEFMKQAVSGAELQDLDADDFVELGVTKMGHKKRLQKRIKMLSHGLDGAFNADTNSDSDDSTSVSSDTASTSSSKNKGGSYAVTNKDDKLTLKCFFGDDISLIKVTKSITFPQLKTRLRKEYGSRMVIRYKDEEGDHIRIRKSSHLKTAIEGVSADNNTLRLYLTERKKKVSNREKSVLDTMVDPVVSANKNGRVLFFNKASEELFGYKREEVVKRNVSMLMPPDVAAKHDGYLKAYAKTKKANIIGVGRDVQARHKDGHLFWVRLSVSETKLDGASSFTGTFRKIEQPASSSSSSAVESSAPPQESFGTMFVLLNQLSDVCIVINESAIIQFWNKAAEVKFGWKSTEVVGKNIKLMMPSEVASKHDQYMARYNSTHEAHIIGIGRDVIAQTKDGSLIPIHLSVTEQQLSATRKLFTAIIREVEEELEAKKSILQQEREVLDNLVVPAIIIDQTGKIHAFNEAASQLLGYTLIEVVSRNISMLMPPDQGRMHDGYIKNYLKTGDAKIIGRGRDVVAQHKDGTMLSVRLSVTEKMDGDRHVFTGILQKL
ncbi:SH3 and multiple ankyrin repeat domains 3 [Balamuthia mandrillaris]